LATAEVGEVVEDVEVDRGTSLDHLDDLDDLDYFGGQG
jgi:hypothetical protein